MANRAVHSADRPVSDAFHLKKEKTMNRSVIGLVVLLWMTTLVPTAQAAARIPSADEFSNGPMSHMDPSEMTPDTSAGVPQMRVDWDVIQDRHGRPMIEATSTTPTASP